jgi:hypothetical protein
MTNFCQASFLSVFKKISSLSFVLLTLSAIPAFAGVSVSSPANGADVSSPFKLSATASACSSQSISAMGYSFDSSSDTTVINSSSIDVSVSASAGSHTLHVKSWGNKGASCVTDVAITVAATTEAATGETVVPSDATNVSSLQTLGGWTASHDSGSGGSSSGSTGLVSSPSQGGTARKFASSFSGSGGERYNVSFGDDMTSANFFYDGWVYISGSASSIANLEMDMNQVMENGQTVIFGFQCDGYSGTWDYTANKGTPTNPSDTWVHSGAKCNPRSWSANTWHHVQVSYSRTSAGVVTYHAVWLDGTEYAINATVSSAFSLGWSPTLLTNFQVDGLGSGSATVYLDNLVVSRW